MEELYSLFPNYIYGQKDINEWDKLNPEQQQGIGDATDELESGIGIPHEKVKTNVH